MIKANPPCILFDEDVDVLRQYLDDPTLCDRAQALVRAKLEGATIVTAENVPGNIATINSRVTYRLGSDVPTTVYLVDTTRPSLFFQGIIPLRSLIGLSLLGMREGDRRSVALRHSLLRISLKRVLQQPTREIRAVFSRTGEPISAGGTVYQPFV